VVLGVLFRRMLMMFGRMQSVPMGDLGMVRGLFVIAIQVMLRRLSMMFSRALVVFRGLLVMFMNFLAAHCSLPACWHRKYEDLP
jgi:hypothetical protein